MSNSNMSYENQIVELSNEDMEAVAGGLSIWYPYYGYDKKIVQKQYAKQIAVGKGNANLAAQGQAALIT